MKALTLHQPWASLIAARYKTIETRPWATRYRGPLAIHAGVRPMRDAHDCHGDADCFCPGVDGIPEALVAPFEIAELCAVHGALASERAGCIVATCELADVVAVDSIRWFEDKWGPTSEPFGWKQLQVIRPPEPADTFVCETELPFGDFTPGRFAWLLSDIEPLAEPVPARGRQGLWEWSS